MRNLEQINRDIYRTDKAIMTFAVIGMIIWLVVVAYAAANLYYLQKNSPSVETRADAQTTNA